MLLSLYTEKDLQHLWERQFFRSDRLLTEDARRVVVEFPGIRSGEGGPDFRAARILLDGARKSGDVELHLTPSGWRRHGHDRDGAYAGVILHVVLRRDPFQETPKGLPILVLEPYLGPIPEETKGDEEIREIEGTKKEEFSEHLSISLISSSPYVSISQAPLDVLGEQWFAERRGRMERARARSSADEVLYREILVALGYKHNKAPMAELARRCPLHSLPVDAGDIEARLRRETERMPREMWRLRNVRPANHPWRRLSGMARFLAAAREEGLARGLSARRSVEEMAAWLDPDGTGHIGPGRAREVVFNVFVPFLGEAAWRRVADLPPPESPGAVGRLLGTEVTTVRKYFGAILRIKRLSLSRPA